MKILAADDHWVSRTGLRHSLSRLNRPVNLFLEASSFAEARKLAAERPDLDLIVLDLLMPDGSGFDEITALTRIAPAVPIIVVSMAESRQDVMRALDAGAMGMCPSLPLAIRYCMQSRWCCAAKYICHRKYLAHPACRKIRRPRLPGRL